jgi:hypothetical protein
MTYIFYKWTVTYLVVYIVSRYIFFTRNRLWFRSVWSFPTVFSNNSPKAFRFQLDGRQHGGMAYIIWNYDNLSTKWCIVTWHLLGHAIKSVTCFDLQFWCSMRTMTSFCIFMKCLIVSYSFFKQFTQSFSIFSSCISVFGLIIFPFSQTEHKTFVESTKLHI